MSDSHASTEGSAATASSAADPRAGMLAPIRGTMLAPLFPGPATGGFPESADPIGGGIDFQRVWHAFRRCWIPALVVAIAIGGVAGAVTFLFMPRGYEAVAWLRVRDKSGPVGGDAYRDSYEYEAYRKTQVQLIKSPLVLMAALRRTGVESLSPLVQEEDKVGWLARNIQVSAPMESEVIQIRTRGENPQAIAQVVNAVTQAYLTDVVHKEGAERLRHRDMLEKKYKENMTEVRSRLDTYNNLAESLGTTDSEQVSTQKSLLIEHLTMLRAQQVQLERDLTLIDAELIVMDATERGEIRAVDSVPEDLVNAMMMRDAQYVGLRGRIAEIEGTIAYQSERSTRGLKDPTVRKLVAARDGLIARLAAHQEELRPQVVAQIALENHHRRNQVATESPAVLRKRRELIASELEKATKSFEKESEEVKLLGRANADLMARKQEIAQLMKVTDGMGEQLTMSELDIQMPNRVELIEEASVPEGSDNLMRLMLTVMAAGAGLVFGGGSVVALEYVRDRLSTTEDITQRIGIRVIGTIPKITRKTNPGQVAECVDGARTVLMQTGREAPNTILVTSATEHEGKTTFASQLAASLARSGKRTLLLDGDLRHPNVHLALGLDLRSGLPELLRGEITSDEAIHPTGVEGLFAITGGACDYTAITALSRPETAKLIAGLRDAFDHVVIDAGPVLAFSDVLLLGQMSDVAVLATMRDRSRVPLIVEAIDKLRSVDVRVVGSVVNGVDAMRVRRMYAATPMPA